MRQSLSLVLVILSFNAFSQNIDSLQNAFANADHDTTRLKALDAIIEDQQRDYTAVEKYSLQMQDLSKTNAEQSSGKLREFYLHYYATALNNLAYVEENKSNNDGAIQSYERALNIFRDIGDKGGEAMCLTNIGYVAKKAGNLAKAIDYYSQALKINREIKNNPGTFAALNNLGLTFFTVGDMNKALTSYFEALKLAEESGQKRRQAVVMNNIAGVYFTQKETKLYREYQQKSLALVVEIGEKGHEANTLISMVKDLLLSKEYGQARTYAARIIEIGKELNNNDLLSQGLSSMANVNKETGKLEEAVALEKQAVQLKRDLGDKGKLGYSLNSMGEILLAMNKTDEAIRYFQEGFDTYKSTGHTSGASVTAKNLSDAYGLKGNAPKALEFYQLHVKLRDSVANEDNRKAAIKAQYKYEYEIKATADSIRAQGEKAVLTAQINQEKSQRYALTAAIILGVTLASFAFYRFRAKQQMKELQLRNRIASDLHDEVGSAISSISLFAGIAKMKSGKESEDIVEKIENTSRETVDNMSDIVWSIEPSNDRFDNVLRKMTYFGEQLMGSLGIRFNFAYENGIEKTTFDMTKRKNIYLIYKEAINNAAKYSGARNVNALLSKDGRHYTMQIKDDGKGFDINSVSFGNGLRNMKRRTEEIGGSLTIESSGNGTSVLLKV